MKLFELRKEIAETHSEYWHGIGEGPLFHYDVGLSDHSISNVSWHYCRWVLQHDVDISIEYGMPTSVFEGDRAFEWSKFPDPKASLSYADIFFRGALVDRVVLAGVDGGRAVVPVPEWKDGQWIVMDWPYQVARLIDDLLGHREFESSFKRTGIYRWPA